MRYIKLQHELIHARYDEPSAKWHLRLRRPATNSSSTVGIHFEEIEDTADVLFTGLGSLSRWTWPDIAGLNEFKGTVLHTAQWDESVQDWDKKKVGVIGVVRKVFKSHRLLESFYCLLFETSPPDFVTHLSGLLCYSDSACSPTEGGTPLQLRTREDLAYCTVRDGQSDGTHRRSKERKLWDISLFYFVFDK
jgi:hypothetical protein